MIVDLHVKQMTISCSTAYGPQENDSLQKKQLFWDYLSEVAISAEQEGKGFLLQGDLNAWLGPTIIKGDDRQQNKNGKLFEAFLKTHKLTVVNSLPLCSGVTTRQRMRQGKLVKSVLDFYVVCQRLLASVVEMKIDNDRKYSLTNFSKVKRTCSRFRSYDNNLESECKYNTRKAQEGGNVQLQRPQRSRNIKTNTSNTSDFSNCFMTKMSVDLEASSWMKLLMTHCAMAFPKIRIRSLQLVI